MFQCACFGPPQEELAREGAIALKLRDSGVREVDLTSRGELAKAFRAFHSVDTDNNGKIDRQEFSVAFGLAGNPYMARFHELMDTDGDLQVDFCEFLAGVAILEEPKASNAWRFCFHLIDRDQDGCVSVRELEEFLQAEKQVAETKIRAGKGKKQSSGGAWSDKAAAAKGERLEIEGRFKKIVAEVAKGGLVKIVEFENIAAKYPSAFFMGDQVFTSMKRFSKAAHEVVAELKAKGVPAFQGQDATRVALRDNSSFTRMKAKIKAGSDSFTRVGRSLGKAAVASFSKGKRGSQKYKEAESRPKRDSGAMEVFDTLDDSAYNLEKSRGSRQALQEHGGRSRSHRDDGEGRQDDEDRERRKARAKAKARSLSKVAKTFNESFARVRSRANDSFSKSLGRNKKGRDREGKRVENADVPPASTAAMAAVRERGFKHAALAVQAVSGVAPRRAANDEGAGGSGERRAAPSPGGTPKAGASGSPAATPTAGGSGARSSPFRNAALVASASGRFQRSSSAVDRDARGREGRRGSGGGLEEEGRRGSSAEQLDRRRSSNGREEGRRGGDAERLDRRHSSNGREEGRRGGDAERLDRRHSSNGREKGGSRRGGSGERLDRGSPARPPALERVGRELRTQSLGGGEGGGGRSKAGGNGGRTRALRGDSEGGTGSPTKRRGST